MNEIYLGAVYDAMRLLGYRDQQFYINIKPMGGYEHLICGPAFTTYGRVVSREENYSALDNIRLQMYKKDYFRNRPIVLLQANDDYCAHSGDITSSIYQALGATGFITDGVVRDIEKINSIKFPVFCQDVNPIDALDYWALTDFEKNIVIKGVEIKPGDMIYASKDGVIRVPKKDFKEFSIKLNFILDKENQARELINKLNSSDSLIASCEDFVKSNGRW